MPHHLKKRAGGSRFDAVDKRMWRLQGGEQVLHDSWQVSEKEEECQKKTELQTTRQHDRGRKHDRSESERSVRMRSEEAC